MRKTLFILFFLVLCSIGFAQDKITISGKVKDKNTNETLPMTPVQISELNVFTVTDMDGNFLFERIPVGTYTFKITSLGYQPLEKEMELTKTMSDMLFLLEVQNLTLDHVEVVAQRGNGMNSSSMVNTQAIEHVQASSLKDVMQLIPGAVTTNTDMSERNLITIRSLDNDVTNAMGTAIIMDGATLSNDMNMQLKGNGDVQVNELTNKTNSSAMAGADARQISTDNIESIEVIRGVPSAEYGNLTSGAVVVKSKAGQSPLEVRFKTDPKLKQVYAGKGVKLNGNSGILNVGADYTNSVRSLVSPVDAYNRFNLTTAYSKNLAKNLTFNARLLGDYSVLSAKTDPDNDNDEHSEETSKSLRLNINGMWTVNSTSPIFVDYLLYASVQEQDDYYHSFERFSARSYPVSKETGIYQGTYTSKDYYYSDLNINGLPLDFQAKMTGKMFSKFGIIDNKILAGFEFQSQGNKGKGKMFNP
ncbi:MAG: TonB-dependent receptor, partial [Bacteroidales bacterium]|nr:TonB-dependent receptor [Bacteroidales bacterium]